MNKTEQEIEQFLKSLGYQDFYRLKIYEDIKLSDLIKLREFLGLKDIILGSGSLSVWQIDCSLIYKSNEDLIQEANELLKEEVELGYIHSIEEWLTNNFSNDLAKTKWLKEYIEQLSDSYVKRSAVLLIGRLSKSFPETKEILSAALLDTNLEVRYAAVCSIVNLGLFKLLQNHNESVEWLARDIEKLLKNYETPNT